MRRFLLSVAVLALTGPAFAQDRTQTLADIRQELTVLNVEIQNLKRELSTTGAPTTQTVSGSVLSRVDAIEAQMVRLTSQTEELQNRIDRVVADGTNRVGDLEFRLVELEGGDLSKLGQTSTLGGGAMPAATPVAPAAETQPSTAPELAVGEQSDFGRASEALASGDFQGAANKFTAFLEAYPGSPLTAEAQLKRGEALEGMIDRTGAARAYLEAFSVAPSGDFAPEALYRLGNMLGQLNQTQEACVTLTEVGMRFPTSPAVQKAEEARARIGCP
jgi:tol-pal system protein YbgF